MFITLHLSFFACRWDMPEQPPYDALPGKTGSDTLQSSEEPYIVKNQGLAVALSPRFH
jgi:hypothetical protein